jgi:large conductance mechanosensitive channel
MAESTAPKNDKTPAETPASAKEVREEVTTDDNGTKTTKKVVRQKEVVLVLPVLKAPRWLQGFTNFMREQGVVGLAVGLVLGTQIKSLVDSLVTNFVNPFLGLLLPGGGDLAKKASHLSLHGKTQAFGWGAFLAQLIAFVFVAAIVYFGVKGLKLDKLDKKKE